MENKYEKPAWEIPITVEAIELLAFNQIKAMCLMKKRREIV